MNQVPAIMFSYEKKTKQNSRQDTATCQIDWEIPGLGREKKSFPNEDST